MLKKGQGNSIIRFHDTRNIFLELSNDNFLQENTHLSTLLLLADVDQIIDASVIKGLKVSVQPSEYVVPVKNILPHIW